MKKETSSFKKNPKGFWEKDGVVYPYVTKIKTDACLKSLGIRADFPPNTFVQYYLDKISRDEAPDDTYLCIASVTKVDSEDKNFYPIPICMLDFSCPQKKEIMKKMHVTLAEFGKGNSKIKDESPIGEINFEREEGFPFEEESFFPEEVYLL
jgi:hypothetical protein